MMVAPSRIEAWVQQHTIGMPLPVFPASDCICCFFVCTKFQLHLLVVIQDDDAPR